MYIYAPLTLLIKLFDKLNELESRIVTDTEITEFTKEVNDAYDNCMLYPVDYENLIKRAKKLVP